MRLTSLVCSFALLLASVPSPGNDLRSRCLNLSKTEMESVVEFLSHDLLEGRATGVRGGQLTEIYMQSVFKLLGLKPGNGDSYLQPFTLKGHLTQELTVTAGDTRLALPDDVVGASTVEGPAFDIEGDAVFVGFGIRTPIWNWDDFKDADLKGKVLLVRVNDPGLYLPDIFEGKALTYFGRWSYKLEEATRTGAAAVLLIHTDETAGYGWGVVQTSWRSEWLDLPERLRNDLGFRGWIQEKRLRQMLQAKGIDLEDLYRKSLKRDFRPVPLNLRVRISGRQQVRDLQTANVLAEIPGRSDKRVVVSAHIDHFGTELGPEGADHVFNGAIDSGSAVAAMVLLAKVLMGQSEPMPYTTTFVAFQAEEAGMLGSRYYVEHADRKQILANLNLESTPVWDTSPDVMGIGASYSTIEDMIQQVAASEGWHYGESSLVDQGFFYRSDQLSFALFNIPSVWISAGERTADGVNRLGDFFKGGNYHTLKDEFDPKWSLEGLRQSVTLTALVLDRINRSAQPPTWKRRLAFPTEGP